MDIEDVLTALDDYNHARRALDRAGRRYDGCSPGWALQSETDDWRDAQGKLAAALNAYIDARVEARLNQIAEMFGRPAGHSGNWTP